MKEIKIFNNLSRKKEALKLQEEGKVKFYSCGPTTYSFLHVGNARALVVGDFISRAMRALGYEVTFVRNFTDVDDKIIKKAQEHNSDPVEYAARFVKECEVDMKELNMLPPDFSPKVSETIPEIIKMAEDIIHQGHGYVKEGEVLFKVSSAKEYGKLSKKDLENLVAGKRVAVAANKEAAEDFVLWKPAKPGEVSWPSPWGAGRPGWHLECSAMAKKYLGETIDLHHGGVDLMFPHHENEIAQSEAANQCEFCANWVHNAFINFGNEKMAKSLGNVVTIRDFSLEHTGQVLRHLLLSVHYRTPLDWKAEGLISKAKDEVKKLHQFALEMEEYKAQGTYEIRDYAEEMREDLANDFNSALVLSRAFMMLNEVRANNLSQASLERVKAALKLLQVDLGLLSSSPASTLAQLHAHTQDLRSLEITEEKIIKLISERAAAKSSKSWTRADEIRKELKALKIEIKDNADGTTTWEKA